MIGRLIVLAPLGWIFAMPVEGAELVYVRKETREATRQATLAATGASELPGKWKYIGPFDNAERKGLATKYSPETAIDFSKSYAGKGGIEAVWRDGDFPDGRINDLNLFGPDASENAIVYLLREITLKKPQKLPISLGSDDSLKVFLNGKEILVVDAVRACAPDQHRVTLDLLPGTNRLLLKVGQATDKWQFYCSPTLSESLHVELRNRLEADFPDTDEGKYYRLVHFPIPESIRLEVGGLGFFKDGSLLIGTRRGKIWLIRNPLAERFGDFELVEWASGLHEITGMLVHDDVVYVAQRPEITTVSDSDGDGRADRYRTFCDGWGISGNYHEYVFGPARDRQGNFYVNLNLGFGGGHSSRVPWRGWCVKIDPQGVLTPFAYGLRSPNGINVSPDGAVFSCDNQGDWVAVCKMDHLQEGRFYGHPASHRWAADGSDSPLPEPTPPAIWFPYGTMSQSASEPLWDLTEGRFGPFAGQCLVGEQVKSLIMRVALEKVGGKYQGACFHFRRGFECGVNRMSFAPDGSLFVGMTSRGWGSVGGKPYGLQRLVHTGAVPFEMLSMKLTETGFDVQLTRPADPESAGAIGSYGLQSYHYHYWKTYGSPEVDRRPVKIEAARLSSDGLTVSLDVPSLKTGKVYELRAAGVRSIPGEGLLHPEAYYTLNRLIGSE